MVDNKLLDQLWYTWSKDGLGSMSAGYRVRAASQGLYNLQDMRYRRLDRFLRYELPQGVNSSEFNSRIAPISLSFVHNGDERLLIRKVFVGRDYAGRNSVFFTHLIAGLPQDFTARDAIRLWYCSDLWADSDQDKASNDTTLPTLPYSQIRAYVKQSQTSFNFAQISEQLKNMLLLILSRGLPAQIYATGHATFTAMLIYGITHCLPLTLLPGLTFTTYESNVSEMEATIVGTISGADLQDATSLKLQPSAPTGPLSQDIQHYVMNAVNCLLTGKMAKLTKLIDEAEKHGYATTDDLIELYKYRFHVGPFTNKHLENIVWHPEDNLEELIDSVIQQKSAELLLKHPDYWETRGKSVFSKVVKGIDPVAKTPLNQQIQSALVSFINAVVNSILGEMQAEILQGNIPTYCIDVLITLAPPASNSGIYQKMLTDFAQGQVYARITSDALWKFQVWLLHCAKLMQPLPTTQQMLPWLGITSWEKLDRMLKLDLPLEWEQLAMFRLIELEIPKSAVQVVQAHEKKFKELLQRLLQQGSQLPKPEYTTLVVRFFAALVEHDYPDRVSLLLVLLNAFPEPRFIDALFNLVRFYTPHQLLAWEIDSVLAGCRPEVIAACSSSPALAQYIQEYILFLTPNKLSNENVQKLLKQLSKEPLPERIANLVSRWLIITAFQGHEKIDRVSLEHVRDALQWISQARQHEQGIDQRQKFIAEINPFLVQQVKTEHDLENVLEILGTFLTNSPWELLGWMAAISGPIYAQSLSRLTPYLLCGIREYARTGQSQSALDDYLQSLYSQVSENALRNIDAAVSSGMWSELIQHEWNSWRERRKPHWAGNILNKLIPQQQKPPTGPQPSQPNVSATSPASPSSGDAQMQPHQQGVQQAHSTPPQVQQSPPMPPLPVAQGQVIASVQQGKASTQAGQVNTPQTQAQIVFHAHEHPYHISLSEYQRLHLMFVQMLPYWSQVLADRLTKGKSKSIAFEVDTILSLLEELRKLPATTVSAKLVEYIEDDLLIRLEINRLNLSASYFLSPENHLPARRSEFQQVVGENVYLDLRQKYTEQGIDLALGTLIRRYHFIQDIEEQKKDWRKWLREERKKAKVEPFKLMQK